MADLSIDALFDAAVRIQLLERSIVISFASGNSLRIKFPITRRLAEFLGIPHYLILRSFALLEQEDLVTKAEREGIVTTKKGSEKMIRLMRDTYRKETEGILGAAIFEELLKKMG
jgi:DNA-binding transcriptional regulator YhcF (GntR family)